jgi:hypothetical protein
MHDNLTTFKCESLRREDDGEGRNLPASNICFLIIAKIFNVNISPAQGLKVNSKITSQTTTRNL